MDTVDGVDGGPQGPYCPRLRISRARRRPLRPQWQAGALINSAFADLPSATGQAPLAQKIFVVQPQLLQAGARHVCQLEFHFLAMSRRPDCLRRCSARRNGPPAPFGRACGSWSPRNARKTARSHHRQPAPPENPSNAGSRHAWESVFPAHALPGPSCPHISSMSTNKVCALFSIQSRI